MDNKIRILYIAGSKIRNPKLLKLLSEKYKVDVCNRIISTDFERDFGKLKYISFHNSQFPYMDPLWDDFISNISEEDFAYKYGIDDDTLDFDSRNIVFGDHIKDFLNKNGFDIKKRIDIPEVILNFTHKSKVIREKDIFKYNLILIEELFTKHIEIDKYTIGKSIQTVEYPYISYRIPLSCLKKYLKFNGSSLILIDDLSAFEDKFINTWFRFNKILEKTLKANFVSLYSSNSSKVNIFLQGADFEHKITNSIFEFKIAITNEYRIKIPSDNSNVYNNVRDLIVDSPFHITHLNKKNNFDKENVLISGNNKTVLCSIENSKWEKDYLSKLYSQNKPSFTIADTINGNNITFGVFNKNKGNYSCVLTGNICQDKFINNSKGDNNQFINNIIDKLLTQNKNIKRYPNEYLPLIKMNVKNHELTIDNIKINLSPMEFCYYRYFVEKAKSSNKIEKFEKVEKTPQHIVDKIYKYYTESFPNNKNLKLKEPINEQNLPKISDLRANISRIKKKIIKNFPKKFEDYIHKYYIDNISTDNFKSIYVLNLHPDKIIITL